MPDKYAQMDDSDTHLLKNGLRGISQMLANGDIKRQEAIQQTLDLLSTMPEVEHRQGPLGSQGRVSFGRDKEGEPGTAVWLPEDPEVEQDE